MTNLLLLAAGGLTGMLPLMFIGNEKRLIKSSVL